MMTDARVVKRTVTTNDNSASQDYNSFPYIPKLTRNYSRNTAHTLLLFSGGIFRLYNLFFQEAQDYADRTRLVEIFMEVSALTVENVSDLVSKVGK